MASVAKSAMWPRQASSFKLLCSSRQSLQLHKPSIARCCPCSLSGNARDVPGPAAIPASNDRSASAASSSETGSRRRIAARFLSNTRRASGRTRCSSQCKAPMISRTRSSSSSAASTISFTRVPVRRSAFKRQHERMPDTCSGRGPARSARDTPPGLLIGAYRDNEVGLASARAGA